MKFSDSFRRLRLEKGLTQSELADRLNVSRSAIGMYEQGKREPDFDTACKMANFFGVDLDVLVNNDFQSASDQLSAAANFFDLCLGRIGWTREWDDDKGKYAFRKNDVVVYFSADEYAELSDGIEKSVEDAILSAIREKIIK